MPAVVIIPFTPTDSSYPDAFAPAPVRLPAPANDVVEPPMMVAFEPDGRVTRIPLGSKRIMTWEEGDRL